MSDMDINNDRNIKIKISFTDEYKFCIKSL